MILQYIIKTIFIGIIFFSLPAKAEEPKQKKSVFVAAKAGGLLHSPFGNLGNGFQLQMEAGVAVFSQLDVLLTFSWDHATSTNNVEDARLMTESSWNTTATLIKTGLLGRWNLFQHGPWAFWCGAGPMAVYSEISTSGKTQDADLPANTQTQWRLGMAASAMGGFAVGPGSILLELSLEISSVDGPLTGNNSTSGTGILLGYRMEF